jgi:hypothetical protein
MLLRVTDLNPWYANIVNLIVFRYVPPGKNKKKPQAESRCHLWDDPYLYRICADGLLRRCVPAAEGMQIIKNAMQPYMEAIMEHSALKPKSGSAVSSGQQCTKTPRNSSEGVRNASCKVALHLAMQCRSTTIFGQKYSMCGALISWGRFNSPKIASTSSLPSTMFPNGWKHYHAGLPTPRVLEGCSMKWSSLALEHQEWW